MSTDHAPVRAPVDPAIILEANIRAPEADSPGSAGARPAPPNLSASKLLVKGKGPLPPSAIPPPPRGDLESILGPDARIRILDTDGAPWRMICYLQIDCPFGRATGTAWFVGPKTLITAGHCIHDKAHMGGWATSIRVHPGRDGDEVPFAPVSTRNFSTVNRWLNNADPDFDYGVIQLDQPLGESVGWFAVSAKTDGQLADELVNISGYPADKPEGTQWFHANKVARVTERRIFHLVDTYPGHSGAPLWMLDANQAPVAVGIHAYGVGGTPAGFGIAANSAPRITSPVLANIKSWIAENT